VTLRFSGSFMQFECALFILVVVGMACAVIAALSSLFRPRDLKPHEKLLIFGKRFGTIWACTPCVKSRGYSEGDLLDGVVVTGAGVMRERIKAGAATLSF
jgi:hypothetical protein